MLPEIDELLRRTGGAATRRRLLTVVTRNQLDQEIRTGRLESPFTGVLCRPWDADFVRERAALLSVGPPAALSHLTALSRWTLLENSGELIHISIPASRSRRPHHGLRVHRVMRMPRTVRIDGLPTVDLPDAVVSSWPLLPAHERREPVITAVRQRLVKPSDMRVALDATGRLAGRGELTDLLGLLEDGCESELEIWGYLGVFDVPGLRHGKRQLWVRTPSGRYRVDIGYEEERVAIELDGARYHGSRAQRERDLRRDAAFAAVDWQTLRFSHERLHTDVGGCRRDALQTLAARRRRRATS